MKLSLSFLNGDREGQLKCFGVFLTLSTPLILIDVLLQERSAFFCLNLFMGILSWTYLEYHLHRFWAHKKKGRSNDDAFSNHMHHHTHPGEIKITPLQRVMFFSISTLLFVLAITWNNYFTLLAGFIIGCSYSFFAHWILHRSWSRTVFPRLHRYHIHHHCKHPDKCFGFTTTLWDDVFGTVPPRQEVIPEKTLQFFYNHNHKHNH